MMGQGVSCRKDEGFVLMRHVIGCHSNRMFQPEANIARHRWTMASVSHRGGKPNFLEAEVIRNQSAFFRAECKRLISETSKRCRDMQNDQTQKLDRRVKEVQFMKTELELKLEEIVVETDELILLQTRVAKALEASREPLRVTLLCVEERRKRGPEMLQDEVDRELLNEREVIEGVASALRRVSEQISEQIRLNRSAKYTLEQDLKEKSEAQHADLSCSMMPSHAPKLQQPPIIGTAQQSLLVSPKQWESISHVNMARAEQQKANSASLRALAEALLEQTFTDMQKQLQATAAAFQLHVQEIKSAKSQMEDQLAEILPELSSQRKIRDDLSVAIKETGQALAKAQAQLTSRNQRPSKELCCDPAQTHLLSEIQWLKASTSRLQKALVQSEEKERVLVRCQLELQHRIRCKADYLYMDEVVCGQHREAVTACRY
ncbi:tektin-1 isoform X2 [Takifugu flavidus]|uniref:Tektin n=1 Tax=Takifugu flavidus TaxID=433684 RepID=A0A5C6PCP9_9TELE|nr:tektin-1 isoform X2 [Takifugu flavidus]TWW76779.1 Tektin-1 [Takifugu flavidus]